jgi:hypothetical protein
MNQPTPVDTLLHAFVAERCTRTPGGLLAWAALRPVLLAWCLDHAYVVPQRPVVLAWFDAHFPRGGDDARPLWAGVTVTGVE